MEVEVDERKVDGCRAVTGRAAGGGWSLDERAPVCCLCVQAKCGCGCGMWMRVCGRVKV